MSCNCPHTAADQAQVFAFGGGRALDGVDRGAFVQRSLKSCHLFPQLGNGLVLFGQHKTARRGVGGRVNRLRQSRAVRLASALLGKR
jgi:hypothetical protein